MADTPFIRTPTTISEAAKAHLRQLIFRWQVDAGYPISLEVALSDLVLSTPLTAPYPTPQNGNAPKD